MSADDLMLTEPTAIPLVWCDGRFWAEKPDGRCPNCGELLDAGTAS